MPQTAGATRPTKTRCLEAAESPARMHRETDVHMRIVPSIRRQRLAGPGTAGVGSHPRGDDAAVSRSAVLRSIARRRSAASTRTVIGSRQLVAGRLDPPCGVRLYSSGVRRRGFLFSRGGRKPQPSPVHHPAGGGGLVAGDGRWRFFPVGACGMRARRPGWFLR